MQFLKSRVQGLSEEELERLEEAGEVITISNMVTTDSLYSTDTLKEAIEKGIYKEVDKIEIDEKEYTVYMYVSQKRGENPVYSYILFEFIQPKNLGLSIKPIRMGLDVLYKKLDAIYSDEEKFRLNKVTALQEEIDRVTAIANMEIPANQGLKPSNLSNDFPSKSSLIKYINDRFNK